MHKVRDFLRSAGRPVALLLITLQLVLLLAPVQALYEDQIGKFDWKRTQIGAIRHAAFHGPSAERIIVATEQNVLAALHTKTGDIAWRKLFEKDDRGSLRFLHVTPAVPAHSLQADDDDSADDPDMVLTVSGTETLLVRGWHAQTGHAAWEWSLTPTTAVPTSAHLWLYDRGQLLHVVPVWGSHLELTAYVAYSGQPARTTTTRISAAWIREQKCVLTQRLFVCLTEGSSGQLLAIDLTSEDNAMLRQPLSGDYGSGAAVQLSALPGAVDTVVVNGDVYAMREQRPLRESKVEVNAVAFVADNLLVQAVVKGNSLRLSSSDLHSGQHSADIDATLDHSHHASTVRLVDVLCKRKQPSAAPICRLLLSTGDGAVVLVQQGQTKWTREEALTDIVAVEMMDLQLSDSEGSIESELLNKDGDILGALTRRLTGQVAHFRNTLLTVLGLGAAPSATQQAGLVRDAFGLHKMLVILTASGKLFGIDNQSGDVHWVRVLPQFGGFAGGSPMQIIVQRSAGHFPLPARCAVLARDRLTGNGLLYQFDPISGQPIGGDGIVRLPYAVRQATPVAHVRAGDFVRALLLLDQQNQAHVVPADAAAQADGMYVYVADRETGVISGYQVRASGSGGQLQTRPIWVVNVSGGSAAAPHRIVQLASKNRMEHVHSQGRVFNDRSVLYKYINPNLVVVATIGPDAVHKSILNIHLLDVVSGGIVYSMSHRRVRQPLHIVHSENWLVYTYYNEKVRRTEVTTVELYEGKSQANGTVWSSLDAPQLPLVERQSYVLPANVVALRETITERGITNKHVLVALSTGSVVEMPWALLDPRRPVLLPNQPREEGIIPYIPELQLPSENVINYNQSVANVRGIAAAPSGLESTCLVMAYGLDIFVTRVAPSKTFDLLKEDFDYMLIMIVLVGLSAASVVVKQLSARKAVKQAWK